ncbi:hypothetical protein BKA65DRAFT_533642 [Rhexocercosporidium sp. MPI-PUGE-AT-0058]|nr:hypothetical protein BKA65DRAFT_533642 [Rhexocercosporidium sp. MPI-PUGE-AT-0058]
MQQVSRDLLDQAKTWYPPQFEVLEQFIYDTWARDDIHKRDLEFGRYIAMLGWPDRLTSTEEVLDTHRALIKRYEEIKPKIPRGEENNRHDFQSHGTLNTWQRENFKIRSFFRGLVIILENLNFSDAPNQEVQLVRTGSQEGLSAPKDFEVLGGNRNTSVTVTLERALRFVIQLEERESAVFPEWREHPLVHDVKLGNRKGLVELIGYPGPEVVGPSTGRIKDDE